MGISFSKKAKPVIKDNSSVCDQCHRKLHTSVLIKKIKGITTCTNCIVRSTQVPKLDRELLIKSILTALEPHEIKNIKTHINAKKPILIGTMLFPRMFIYEGIPSLLAVSSGTPSPGDTVSYEDMLSLRFPWETNIRITAGAKSANSKFHHSNALSWCSASEFAEYLKTIA